MMKEQKKIMKNMPDGVLIHKKTFEVRNNNDGLSSLVNFDCNATTIHYFNNTFK